MNDLREYRLLVEFINKNIYMSIVSLGFNDRNAVSNLKTLQDNFGEIEKVKSISALKPNKMSEYFLDKLNNRLNPDPDYYFTYRWFNPANLPAE